MGYRDQDGAVHGPYALDDTKIHDKWLALSGGPGAPVGDDITSPCSLAGAGPQATFRIQRFERGYIQYCGSANADYIAYGKTYLPDTEIAYNNWNSLITVRSIDTSSRVNAYFYNPDGTVADSRVYDPDLAANAMWIFDTSSMTADNGEWVNPIGNIAGSAVVAAELNVVAMAENRNGAMRYAYTGQAAPVSPEHLPQTIQNLNNVWYTTIRALNTGAANSDLTTTFYNGDGSTAGGGPVTLPNVPSNGSGDVSQSSLPGGYYGTGRITANQSVAAVTQVWEPNNASRRLGYSSLPVADPTVFLPFVMTRLGNGWGAAIWIQNTYEYQTTITVEFYNDTQSDPVKTTILTVNGLGLATLNLRTNDYGLGWGWFGSARIRSVMGAPLAAVVNQFNDGSNLGASYEGVPAPSGTTKAVLPYVVRRFNTCYISNYTVRNLGLTDATIDVRYYREDGTLAPNSGSTSDETVKSHKVYNLYNSTPPANHAFPANGFRGSVAIISTNNQPIAVSSNLLNYCGGSDTISYTGINR
jgi:hypothetical protein